MVADVLVEVLRPFADLILPGVFAAFVLGTLFVVALTDRHVAARLGLDDDRLAGRIRSIGRVPDSWILSDDANLFMGLWATVFVAGILFTSLIGAPILPFIDMNKYAEPAEEEFTYYEIRMVDGQGNELRYDMRAVPPVQGGSRHSRLAGMMVDEFSEAERLEMAAFLFEEGVEYRAEVEAGESSAVDRLRAPRYNDAPPWTRSDLDEMSSFETMRIYERSFAYSDDDTEIESRSERLLLEYDPDAETIHERGEA